MRRKEQRSMLMLAIVMAFVVGVFWAGPVGAGNPCDALQMAAERLGCPGAPVEKTGQTASHAIGDDGNLTMGVAWPDPRFTDNGDGTVTDNLTGLMWLKDATCLGDCTWPNAFTCVNNLNSGSEYDCDSYNAGTFGDWRLPNVKELQSLIDYGSYHPALPSGHPFTGVVSAFYWSSTTYADLLGYAWYVNLGFGYVDYGYKDDGDYVWPVRGGQ